MREKLNSKVLFDEDSWTRFQSEVPKVRFLCIFYVYLLGGCKFCGLDDR
jgi:hypothetical protein